MICPAPGAIVVKKTGKPAVWNPPYPSGSLYQVWPVCRDMSGDSPGIRKNFSKDYQIRDMDRVFF